MTTYYSDKVNSAAPGKELNQIQAKAGIGVCAVKATKAVTVALVTNDVIDFVQIPANATILDVKLASSGSIGATASLEVGVTGDDTDRFISAASHASAAVGSLNNVAGVGYTNTSAYTISVKAASMASGTTNASLTMTVLYTMNP